MFGQATSEKRALEEELIELRKEVATLKHEKKLEEEDIKHLVRIKEERLQIEFEKKKVEADGEKASAIEAVKDKYRDKLEHDLRAQLDRMQQMYGEILTRLPDVNLRLKSDV